MNRRLFLPVWFVFAMEFYFYVLTTPKLKTWGTKYYFEVRSTVVRGCHAYGRG